MPNKQLGIKIFKKTNAYLYIFIKIQKSMTDFCTKLLATRTDRQTQTDSTEEDARHNVYFLQLERVATEHFKCGQSKL